MQAAETNFNQLKDAFDTAIKHAIDAYNAYSAAKENQELRSKYLQAKSQRESSSKEAHQALEDLKAARRTVLDLRKAQRGPGPGDAAAVEPAVIDKEAAQLAELERRADESEASQAATRESGGGPDDGSSTAPSLTESRDPSLDGSGGLPQPEAASASDTSSKKGMFSTRSVFGNSQTALNVVRKIMQGSATDWAAELGKETGLDDAKHTAATSLLEKCTKGKNIIDALKGNPQNWSATWTTKIPTNFDNDARTLCAEYLQTHVKTEEAKQITEVTDWFQQQTGDWKHQLTEWDKKKVNFTTEAIAQGDKLLTEVIRLVAVDIAQNFNLDLSGTSGDVLKSFDEEFKAHIKDKRVEEATRASRESVVRRIALDLKDVEDQVMKSLIEHVPADWEKQLKLLKKQSKWDDATADAEHAKVRAALDRQMADALKDIKKSENPSNWETKFTNMYADYGEYWEPTLTNLKIDRHAREKNELDALAKSVTRTINHKGWLPELVVGLQQDARYEEDLKADVRRRVELGATAVTSMITERQTLLKQIERFKPSQTDDCYEDTEVDAWETNENEKLQAIVFEILRRVNEAKNTLQALGLSTVAVDSATSSVDAQRKPVDSAIQQKAKEARRKIQQWENELTNDIMEEKPSHSWKATIQPQAAPWQKKADALDTIFHENSDEVKKFRESVRKKLSEAEDKKTVHDFVVMDAQRIRDLILSTFRSRAGTSADTACKDKLLSKLMATESAMMQLVQTEFDRQLLARKTEEEENTKARSAEQISTNELIRKEKAHDAELQVLQKQAAARARLLHRSLATLKQLKEKTDRRKRYIDRLNRGGVHPDDLPESDCACLGSVALLLVTLSTVIALRLSMSPAAVELDAVRFYRVSHEPWGGEGVDAAFKSASRDRREEMRGKLWNATGCSAEGSASPACSCAYGIVSGIPPSAATSVAQGASLSQVMALTGNLSEHLRLYDASAELAASMTQHNNVNASWNSLLSVLKSYSDAQWAAPDERTFARASTWAGAKLDISPVDALAACNRIHHHRAKANLDGWLQISRTGLITFLVLLLCLERLLSLIPIRTKAGDLEESNLEKLAKNITDLINRKGAYSPATPKPEKPKQTKKLDGIAPQEVNVNIAEVKAVVEDAQTRRILALERIPNWVHGLGGIGVCVVASVLAPNGVGWAACIVITVTSCVVLLVCNRYKRGAHAFYFCATLQVLAWIGLVENGSTDLGLFYSVCARAVATSLLYVSSRSDPSWMSRGLMCVMWLNDFWAPYMDDASRSEVQPLPYLPTILLLVTLWVPRGSSSRVLMHELLVAIVLVYFLREHTVVSRAAIDTWVTETMQADASEAKGILVTPLETPLYVF